MSPLKFCANLSFLFQDCECLLDRYGRAKRAGFQGVECTFPYDFPVSKLQEAKEKAKVEQVLLNTCPGNLNAGEIGFAALPGKEKEFRDSLDTTVTYAKALRCRRIHVVAGRVQSRTPEHDKVYEENLRYAANIFEKENIIGVIEAVNPYMIPDFYLNSYEKAVKLIDKIGSPNMTLLLDIFHLQFLHGNLTNNIKSWLPHAGHVQVSQVPDRHEPDSAGEINYAYVFSLLKELKYSGWIGLEYQPASGSTEAGLKFLSKV